MITRMLTPKQVPVRLLLPAYKSADVSSAETRADTHVWLFDSDLAVERLELPTLLRVAHATRAAIIQPTIVGRLAPSRSMSMWPHLSGDGHRATHAAASLRVVRHGLPVGTRACGATTSGPR